MSADPTQRPPESASDTPQAAGTEEPRIAADTLAVLRQIERSLEEIRARLEARARAQRHREFSFARLLGAMFQVLVLGLVIAALSDWLYQAPPGTQLVKLAFAGVLQLAALTAYLMAREGR